MYERTSLIRRVLCMRWKVKRAATNRSLYWYSPTALSWASGRHNDCSSTATIGRSLWRLTEQMSSWRAVRVRQLHDEDGRCGREWSQIKWAGFEMGSTSVRLHQCTFLWLSKILALVRLWKLFHEMTSKEKEQRKNWPRRDLALARGSASNAIECDLRQPRLEFSLVG